MGITMDILYVAQNLQVGGIQKALTNMLKETVKDGNAKIDCV